MCIRDRSLAAYALVGFVKDLIYSHEINYAGELNRGWQFESEVSTDIGQFEAVRAGADIGICHNLMAAGTDLARLVPELSLTRSYWIVWHENLWVARRVQAVAEMLDAVVREELSLFLLTLLNPKLKA